MESKHIFLTQIGYIVIKDMHLPRDAFSFTISYFQYILTFILIFREAIYLVSSLFTVGQLVTKIKRTRKKTLQKIEHKIKVMIISS